MVHVQSVLRVVDNSGARFAQCIRVLGKAPGVPADIGDVIVVTVKRATPNKKIKKGTIQRAVIVRTAKQYKRTDGSRIRFSKTCVVLLNKSMLPIGTRIFGPVCKELRERKFVKILSLCSLSL